MVRTVNIVVASLKEFTGRRRISEIIVASPGLEIISLRCEIYRGLYSESVVYR